MKTKPLEQKILEVMDNHHCIVTEELGKRCVEAISNLVEEEVKKACANEYARGWYNAWKNVRELAEENGLPKELNE